MTCDDHREPPFRAAKRGRLASRSDIAFLCHPTVGHLNTLLSIGLRMKSEGHSARYFIPGGPDLGVRLRPDILNNVSAGASYEALASKPLPGNVRAHRPVRGRAPHRHRRRPGRAARVTDEGRLGRVPIISSASAWSFERSHWLRGSPSHWRCQ